MKFERPVVSEIETALDRKPLVLQVLIGPRQSGLNK